MKRPGILFFGLLILVFGWARPDAIAQQDAAQNNLLPEIDPQDIEIRSEFTARFPGLRRQPILGFNPEPRVYQVDPNRMPFMESMEEVVANLPITDLSRPAPPANPGLAYSPEVDLFGRIGVGSFISPEAEIWGVKHFSETSYLGGRFDFHSSDGHLDTPNSSFRFFNGDLKYATKVGERTALAISGGGESSFNRMFALPTGSPNTLQVPSAPRKDYRGLNAQVSLSNHRNSVAGWNADLGIRSYQMQMEAGNLGGDVSESLVNFTASRKWAGNRLHETYGAELSGVAGSYELPSLGGSETVTRVSASGSYGRLIDYSTQLNATAGAAYLSNGPESNLYPVITLGAKHWLQKGLSISATLEGSPKMYSLEELHRLNRFLSHRTPVRPSYNVRGNAGIRFSYFEGSSLYMRLGYLAAQSYAYFTRRPLQEIPAGYYMVNYMDATRLRGEAGISHQLVPEKLWVSATGYIQKPKLEDGTDIPYEESWGVNSAISVKPLEQLRIEASADYVSKRNTLSSGTVEGFFLIGTRLEIQVTNRFGAYAKLHNLLNQDYEIWNGYTERPFQAYIGVTVKLD